MADTTLTFTEGAIANIGNMQCRVGRVRMQYGPGSDEYRDMAWSLLHALIGMIRLGGRITAEDDLSLLGFSFIDYGVVFHAEHIGDGARDELLGEWGVHS